MKRAKNSIKTKFTLTIVGTIFIFLMLLLLVSYQLMKDGALTNADELASTILTETDKQIDNFFTEIERLARSFANYEMIYRVKVPEMRELIITAVEARQDYLRALYLGTKEGVMYEWGIGKGFVDHVPVFLPDDYDPRTRPWYEIAMQYNDFAITPPYLYASIEALGITCVLPVYTPEHAFVGVLGVDILLEDLKWIVESLDIQKKGKAVLLHQPNLAIINQMEPDTDNSSKTRLKEFTSFDVSKKLNQEEGNFISASSEGNNYFVSYKTNNTTGWTVMIAFPYEEVMSLAFKNVQFIVFLQIILMSLLTVFIGFLNNRIIINPLQELVGVIQRIKSGDNEARVDIRTDDELAVLGMEFNHLVDKVNEYSKRIEDKVKQRTAQLAKLQQENIRLRVVEEKERIYGYLHDSLGARLTNIYVSNNVAKSLTGMDNKQLLEMLGRIEENTQKGIDDLKEILSGTEPPARSIIDFNRLISRSIKKNLEIKNIDFNYTISHPERLNSLSRELRFEIEKILQELVSNVLKHSQADQVELFLTSINGELSLVFQDNGLGFDPEIVIDNGYGLYTMRQRVKLLKGSLSIESNSKQGTRVSITIPRTTHTDTMAPTNNIIEDEHD